MDSILLSILELGGVRLHEFSVAIWNITVYPAWSASR